MFLFIQMHFGTLLRILLLKHLPLTSKSTEFGKALSIFEQALRSVKFTNSEDNPDTSEVRKISISVKDAAPSATNSSDSQTKLVLLLHLI